MPLSAALNFRRGGRLSADGRMTSTRNGFTLIEILVVVAIIGVLAALVVPSLARDQQTATRGNNAANLRQIALAVLTYNSDNNKLPGPIRRGIIVPREIKNSQRMISLASVLIDGNYIKQNANSDGIWRSPMNTGSTGSDTSYVVSTTSTTTPQYFFGRDQPDSATNTNHQPKSVFIIEQLTNNREDLNEKHRGISQVWMMCNADGQNYSTDNGVAAGLAI